METLNKKQTILIVDDNRISRRITSTFLKSLGAKVEEAEDGYKAIEFIEKSMYTAVFINQYLPSMSGYETTRKIRKLKKNNMVPIILVTSGDSDEMSDEMIAAGFTSVVLKPFNKDELRKLLQSFDQKDNNENPIFDYEKYKETFKDVGLQKDIIETFLAEEDSDTNRIKAAFLTNNGDEIYSAVHYMKGSFSYLKASRILVVTQLILDFIKQGKLAMALPYKNEFIQQYMILVNELKKIKL